MKGRGRPPKHSSTPAKIVSETTESDSEDDDTAHATPTKERGKPASKSSTPVKRVKERSGPDSLSEDEEASVPIVKKGRGRPPKNGIAAAPRVRPVYVPTGKPRGRPRKDAEMRGRHLRKGYAADSGEWYWQPDIII